MPALWSASLRPARQRLIRPLAAALLAISCGVLQADEKWPIVVTADHSDQCAQALSGGRQQTGSVGLIAPFSVLNWNVEKAQHPDLVSEFAAYAERSDLIFIQEAVPLKKNETVIAQSQGNL